MTVTPNGIQTRAALYLRVSTARQAEHDVSIPDQKRQGEAHCVSRGLELVETFVEAGASDTNDRRPDENQKEAVQNIQIAEWVASA